MRTEKDWEDVYHFFQPRNKPSIKCTGHDENLRTLLIKSSVKIYLANNIARVAGGIAPG